MNFLSLIWGFLNGKKTFISSIAIFVAAVLNEVVIGIWEFDPDWIERTISTLNWIGGVGWMVGAGHKAAKVGSGSRPFKGIN